MALPKVPQPRSGRDDVLTVTPDTQTYSNVQPFIFSSKSKFWNQNNRAVVCLQCAGVGWVWAHFSLAFITEVSIKTSNDCFYSCFSNA